MRERHGFGKTGFKPPEYHVWQHMRQRCLNSKDTRFKDYGGRGITICDRWKQSFLLFLEDMGTRPSPEHSIERRDNNGPYSKENCYWATRSQQQMNKRTHAKAGVRGVRPSGKNWQAYTFSGGVFQQLYFGPSFEEAVKSRKNFELSLRGAV